MGLQQKRQQFLCCGATYQYQGSFIRWDKKEDRQMNPKPLVQWGDKDIKAFFSAPGLLELKEKKWLT